MCQALTGIFQPDACTFIFFLLGEYPVLAIERYPALNTLYFYNYDRLVMFTDTVFKNVFNKGHQYQRRYLFIPDIAGYVKINGCLLAYP
jgi:hypothetical protein